MSTPAPTFRELLNVFTRIGCLSFGGPAGQIALMHRELVEERKWVSEEEYLSALNFCHLLPGPEAQQLATWVGWKLHGLKGGLAAGLLFVIPGALVILALSVLYGYAADLRWFQAIFLGVKAAVLAIVVQALLRIAGRALNTGVKKIAAAAAFVGLCLFQIPFPLIIAFAGLAGILIASARPEWLAIKQTDNAPPKTARPWAQTLRSVLVWGSLWALPMALILVTLGQDHVLWQIGAFFSKLAVVTFGGAYAVLAYMAQQAVEGFRWLGAGEMADGLGLAETTPGPLIMVTQFVGYLAAFRLPEPFSPLMAGLMGAAITTWVTFVPCFLWIFALAPWVERLKHNRKLQGGLAMVTASVVGVIANLTLWFALHVLFYKLNTLTWPGGSITVPTWASLDWRAAVLAVTAAIMIFALKWRLIPVLGLCALAGLVIIKHFP